MNDKDQDLPTKSSRAPEPEQAETSSREAQEEATTPVVIPEVDKNRGIEGHPLPEALRGVSAAFRSQFVFKLLQPWVNHLTKEHEQCKSALVQANDKLQNEKAENAGLKMRLSESGRRISLALIAESIGGLGVGLSPLFYDKSIALGNIILAFGLVMLISGWFYGRSKD